MPILTNSKFELFAQARAQGKSASEAYVAAGYKAHTGNAARMSANESIKSRVEELLSAGAEKAGVTVQAIVEELAKIGFSDIRKAVRWNSNVTEIGEDPDTGEMQVRAFNQVVLIDSDKIDAATAAALSEVSQTKEGALKIKFHDKLSALEKLGKHLGMFKDKVELSGDVTAFTFKLDSPNSED